ncbi:MAG: pckG [Chlamydiales bacterium]|jgi:phosphoenolpyruvate carboxykinase (GTP)|nr:pckG [Chlamydiales bacterium]
MVGFMAQYSLECLEEELNRRGLTGQLRRWILESASLTCPSKVHFCDGSQEEFDRLAEELVQKGSLIRLNEKKRPGSYLARSHAGDVARVEERTFICSASFEDTGPTNHWRDPLEMREHLQGLFQGCMQGRTLYIIPYSMGPIGSAMSKIGVQLTDSPYVVLNMHLMTRVSLDLLSKEEALVRCLHSVGSPLKEGEEDSVWPCCPEKTVIAHFPEDLAIFSFGSGYGGNALLGKKCFALRIASKIAHEEGWFAEHMLILGLTNPEGKKKYIAASFPSACGKTNLAMLRSKLPGWHIECVGDDIAWMRFDPQGRLRAINPENGFFGVAPGTSLKSNPNAMRAIEKNALFTNVALTADGDVWWEGLSPPPEGLTDWRGQPWAPGNQPAAHPNARFTVSAKQCPVIDPAWEAPEGVEIAAILFGGRRKKTIPLVYEARNWAHGVFLGAAMSSETTAAAAGQVGALRHDPFAMLPFCGYHMADYFAHWLKMGEKTNHENAPKFFHVNWFRQDEAGNWLWPGFGENARVLKWIFERCDGAIDYQEYPIGYVPSIDSLDIAGLDLAPGALQELFHIDREAWLQESRELAAYFRLFGDRLPSGLSLELEALKEKLEPSAALPAPAMGALSLAN